MNPSLATLHAHHYRLCNCLNDHWVCCVPGCACKSPSPTADTPGDTVTPNVWPPPFPSGRRNYAWTPHEWPNRNYIRLPDDPTKPAA
jgi:hypothetical protein